MIKAVSNKEICFIKAVFLNFASHGVNSPPPKKKMSGLIDKARAEQPNRQKKGGQIKLMEIWQTNNAEKLSD